jgi:hypothetical protein
MKLLIAKIWLGILGLAFIGLVVFTIMQVPVEIWVAIGIFLGLGTIAAFTKWSIDQLPDIEDKVSAVNKRK